MSAEKISELDKRVSSQEVTLTRVLEAQERAANSTEELNKSVIELTTEFRYIRKDVERATDKAETADERSRNNEAEIKVIKSGSKWKDWAGRAITTALALALLYSIAPFLQK